MEVCSKRAWEEPEGVGIRSRRSLHTVDVGFEQD